MIFPLGVSLHMLDGEQRLETIRLLQGSMVKSVELWEQTFPHDEASIAEARRLFASAGVAVRSVHARFGASLDLSAADSASCRAGLQAVGAALALALRMGARLVVVHPSSEPIADAARGTRLGQARRHLALLADLFRGAGCRMAVELLPRTCLGRTPEELLQLVDGLDPETVGICLDTNHLMERYATLPAVVRTLGPRLVTLHCSDYDGIDEKHWPLLRGVINWPAFVAALRDSGYDGPLHCETHLDGDTPAARLACLEAAYRSLCAQVGSAG